MDTLPHLKLFSNDTEIFLITKNNKLYSYSSNQLSLISSTFYYNIFKAKYSYYGYTYNNNLYLNGNIILTNTFFNPTAIEIEMVEHDASTLANALYGNQSKAITPGIYTIYDKDNNIYKQYNLYEIKDQFNDTLYEVREERDNIDESLNLDNIKK